MTNPYENSTFEGVDECFQESDDSTMRGGGALVKGLGHTNDVGETSESQVTELAFASAYTHGGRSLDCLRSGDQAANGRLHGGRVLLEFFSYKLCLKRYKQHNI
ncbi:hypothetical protein NC653_041466 [Populus alba x Populus x berolinensis]|uniref:Uncharacterized protein n=1 Tax=Populus alba x Populus x berolinensis TaxID=444605 RepID=A0AAD6L9I5_9ROSI|nr:hypothetical protein NC653_041466 [Populus alba x Populus x berolinensis]